MKSGKALLVTLNSKINLAEYDNAHSDLNCKGKWQFNVCRNIPYNVDVLGIVQVPLVPFIACPECKASYLMPGFEELLDKTLAFQLIANKKILTPNQIRFLRIAFDLTQQDVSDFLEIQRTYYSKTESTKGNVALSPDKQVRLKLFYAEKLGIKDVDLLYKMIQIDSSLESPRIHIDEEEFESDVKEALHLDEKLIANG